MKDMTIVCGLCFDLPGPEHLLVLYTDAGVLEGHHLRRVRELVRRLEHHGSYLRLKHLEQKLQGKGL